MRKVLFCFVFAAILFLPILSPVRAETSSLYLGKTYTCICDDICQEYIWPYDRDLQPKEMCGNTCTQTNLDTHCQNGVTRNCAKPGVDCIVLENPLNIKNENISVPVILGNVIKGFLGVIGSLALLMMVWGGFQWLTSMGNPEKVKSGTNTMLWATIGIVLVFSSYVLVTNLFSMLIPTPTTTTKTTATK